MLNIRVLFCGGGTAGHVNPAIAVAETIMRNSSENRVAYVTTPNGIENQLVSFKKFQIDVIGLKRKLTLKNLSFIKKQLKAIEKSKQIVNEFHPDIVFGTGGYATYPVAIAAKKMGVPVVLHESNVIPGKAILALQNKADKILINFSESKKYFKVTEKLIHTGNPIRIGFEYCDKDKYKKMLGITEKYVILCTGGSLGARRINKSAIELIENFIKYRSDILFIWSAGKNEYQNVIAEMNKRGLHGTKNVMVCEYISNMPEIMSCSDLVISRAGAMTISELAHCKKASILVPSTNVTNNHQYINAKALEASNATILITEDRLFTIVDVVKDLIDNKSRRMQLEKNIGEFSKDDANKRIYNLMLSLL